MPNSQSLNNEITEEVRISVRRLVEFLLRSGDIDNRHQGGSVENAMQEGSRIHRKIQKNAGPEYMAEVPLSYTDRSDTPAICLEGRADGILATEGGVVIDEIKGTYRRLERMREPVCEHLAQAKCYAYMYAVENDISELQIRLTYVNIDTDDIRYFYENITLEELKVWFDELMKAYRIWARYMVEWRSRRQASIAALSFPFEYRAGQKELMAQVYQTILERKKLYLEAPTGVGKTISTIYPGVAAMGKGHVERIFYLTAKTITRGVAEDTFETLRGNGLSFKSVVITARDKICFAEHKSECNPEACSYAKGHYDRINDCLYDLLCNEERLSRDVIERYAIKHEVCPFELCLDACLFADAIICDYNYLFDPDVQLKRFFGGGDSTENLFLIDEAHNLVDRGREMYSSILHKNEIWHLCREIKRELLAEVYKPKKNKGIAGQISLVIDEEKEKTSVSEKWLSEAEMTQMTEEGAEKVLSVMDGERIDTLYAASGKSLNKSRAHSVLIKEGYAEKMIYHLDKVNKLMLELKRMSSEEMILRLEQLDELIRALTRLHATLSDYLEEREEGTVTCRDDILEVFFDVSHFLTVTEQVDEHYVIYTSHEDDGDFMIKLFCVDPSAALHDCMALGRSSILFSATFLPIQYYKGLLGGENTDYEAYARSVFDNKKRALLIANDVTTKYTRRSEDEFRRIARYVETIVHARAGNYLIFCPSYGFLYTLYDLYTEEFATSEQDCLLQSEQMTEEDREQFLDCFRSNQASESVVGFCVLGGVFGEGIDLRGESLIGVVVVGTGIPQVCFERELLKDYFDAEHLDGFNYAYRYPGMNKVQQAAGRLIRTEEDEGVIALLDERFLQGSNLSLFPLEWNTYERMNISSVERLVENFWNKTDKTE